MATIIALVLGLFVFELKAHEGMIQKGYFSCLACHQSSTGGGHLTQYGRGIARGSSLRGGEYAPGRVASGLSLDGRLTHQVQARVAHYRQEDRKRTFPMQADYLGAVQFNRTTSARLIIARTPETEVSGLEQFIVRQGVVRHEWSEDWAMEVGRDRLAYGLTVEDHTLLTQSQNRLGPTDFPTQLKALREGENHRTTLAAVAPSFQEVSTNREWGGALKHEWLAFEDGFFFVLGGSALQGQTEKIRRGSLGLHAKLAWSRFALLAQMDRTHRKLRENNIGLWQTTGMGRMEFHPWEWLVTHFTYEWLDLDEPFARRTQVQGLGLRGRLSESWSVMADAKQSEARGRRHRFFIGQLILNLF